jgi:Plasmid pRiA4b ORF-3-like protein
MEREPLEDWQFRISYKQPHDKREQALLEQELDLLEDWLGAPPEGRRREMPHLRGRWFSTARLKPADIPRAEELYRRVVATTGTGKTYAEEALLSLLACALDPSTIPFFVAMLDLAPPRDKLAARRRQLSLAALALLGYQSDHAGAIDALIGATRHAHPQVRALAIYYLRLVYIGDEEVEFAADEQPPAGDEGSTEEPRFSLRRPIPPQLVERMIEIVFHDTAFEPRFMARMFLLSAGQPAPLDNPDGAYALKVKFKYDKRTYRTIEMRSEETLEDLHDAIQSAWRWDSDHLYSFFMNGQRGDERYRFSSPWEEDVVWWAHEGVLGALGLTLKHKFLYLFDYGDNHEFEIEVVGIREKAEPGTYPRVIDSNGKAPRQYRYAEDDEDEDEDLEDEAWDEDE